MASSARNGLPMNDAALWRALSLTRITVPMAPIRICAIGVTISKMIRPGRGWASAFWPKGTTVSVLPISSSWALTPSSSSNSSRFSRLAIAQDRKPRRDCS